MAREQTANENMLKNADLLAWRIMNKKRQDKREHTHSLLNERPRLRRETHQEDLH